MIAADDVRLVYDLAAADSAVRSVLAVFQRDRDCVQFSTATPRAAFVRYEICRPAILALQAHGYRVDLVSGETAIRW